MIQWMESLLDRWIPSDGEPTERPAGIPADEWKSLEADSPGGAEQPRRRWFGRRRRINPRDGAEDESPAAPRTPPGLPR